MFVILWFICLFHLVAVAVRNVIAFCFCSISTFVPVGRYNRVVAQPHLADIQTPEKTVRDVAV
jgi:hypothetical protein